MKVLSIPSSGKIANTVAYRSPFGMCHRTRVVPKNPRSPAQQHMRRGFGGIAQAWSPRLTQAQRDLWNYAGPKIMSHPRLGQGPLTGQQHYQSVNSARFCIGLPPLLTPPAPIVLPPNPVKELLFGYVEGRLRLRLRVSQEAGSPAAPVSEDIMVFGQAPCSAGRSKRRNVSYLGLLPIPLNGMSDITDIYVAKYGEPSPGQKVFIVTVQQKDGWEGFEQETSEIVPEKPADQQAIDTGALTLQVHMHKGCTRDAQGTSTPPVPGQDHPSALPTADDSVSLSSPGGEGRGEEAAKS